MADESHEARVRKSVVRALGQHLESLARAGLDRIPLSQPLPALRGSSNAPAPVHAARAPAQHSSEQKDMPARGEDADVTEPHTGASLPVSTGVAGVPSSAPAKPFSPELPAPSLAVLFGSAAFDQPPAPACDRPGLLNALAQEVAVCRRCPHLAERRTQTVFGTGKADTRLMFIGEAPGADEDRIGEPFVGRAGQLLTDMITKGMGLTRDQVYIANVLKCRPPENRTPNIDEANNCSPYLEQQIAIIRPQFLCLLGKVAAQAILNTTHAIGKLRGKWHHYRGIPTLVTYHPSYLLRTPSAKKDSWEDLQMLMKEMGLVRPGSSKQ